MPGGIPDRLFDSSRAHFCICRGKTAGFQPEDMSLGAVWYMPPQRYSDSHQMLVRSWTKGKVAGLSHRSLGVRFPSTVLWSYGLVVKTSDCLSEDRGSIPRSSVVLVF